MNYLYGRAVGEYKDRMEKRLEIAAKGRPFKVVLEKIKTMHASWLDSLLKYISMSVSLSSSDLLKGDEVPSLDTAYTMLGRAITRKGYLDAVAEQITRAFGNRFARCRDIDQLNIRCESEVSLIQELIAGLLSKKYEEARKKTAETASI